MQEEYIFIHDALVEALKEGIIEGVKIETGECTSLEKGNDTKAEVVTTENKRDLIKEKEIEPFESHGEANDEETLM